jgi:hypothetical protein
MLKRTTIGIFLFLFLAIHTSAQDFGKVHKLVTEGINSIYEIDFPAALSKFQQAKTLLQTI